jgi:hypothetical protein
MRCFSEFRPDHPFAGLPPVVFKAASVQAMHMCYLDALVTFRSHIRRSIEYGKVRGTDAELLKLQEHEVGHLIQTVLSGTTSDLRYWDDTPRFPEENN